MIKVLIIVVIVMIFLVISVINAKIKKPEGCEEEQKECESCTMRCIHNMNKKK